MVKGYLKIGVLKELYVSDLSGYDLMGKLEEHNGNRPSAGSMYPLLQDLERDGLISCRQDGRRKVYSLTKKGQKAINKLCSTRTEMMKQKLELLRTTGSICGDRKILGLKKSLEKLRKKGCTCKRNIEPWIALHEVAMGILSGSDYEDKEKEALKVVRDATNKLERIRRGGK